MRPFTQGLEPLAEFVCVDAPSLAMGSFGWWHAVSNDGDDIDAVEVFARPWGYDGRGTAVIGEQRTSYGLDRFVLPGYQD